MKLTTPLLLTLATSATANKDPTSSKSQCHHLAKLIHTADLASNTTELTQATHNNATKAAEIQAQASANAGELQTLQANATLMATCNAQFANQDTLADCRAMHDLEKLEGIANNSTKLAEHSGNNATRAGELQAQASAQAGELRALQGNATLTGVCAAHKDERSCKKVERMEKDKALAGNSTALNIKFKGDAAEMARFQAKVAEKATKLDKLTANATLMDTCQRLGINTVDTAASGKGSKKSAAAGGVLGLAGGAQILALVSALGFAMCML